MSQNTHFWKRNIRSQEAAPRWRERCDTMYQWVGGPRSGRNRPMKIRNCIAGALAVVLLTATVQAEVANIPSDQIDKKKIFWGSAESFSKAARVDYEKVIKATPEFKTMKDDRVERGSGKYWILMSQASDRVVKALAHVGEETDYDLICASGYLKGLDPPVASDDLTEKVIEAMEELMGD